MRFNSNNSIGSIIYSDGTVRDLSELPAMELLRIRSVINNYLISKQNDEKIVDITPIIEHYYDEY
jgi:hypothetical protein